MTFSVLHGDCLELMPVLGENSVDSIVTDPPYGLSFMGKDWDHGVPGVHFWQEAFKVLKPGGYLLAFGGTRTFHRLACAIEDAGFELRDTIMWLYGQGFPKSHNGPWGGTALKPAYEPIILARKPLIGTVAANVLAHGTGGLNIDGCRVATDDSLGGGNTSADVDRTGKHEGWQRPWMADPEAAKAAAERSAASVARSEALGRWPANLLHDGSDDVLAGFLDSKGQLADVSATAPSPKTSNVYGAMRREGEARADSENEGVVGFKMKPGARRMDAGSAARFFYCAKTGKADRDEGLDDAPDRVLAMSNQAKAEQARGNLHQGKGGMNTGKVRKNHHPTVKPTDLMRYLCRLVTPPGGIVLDPFTGSGSTGKAAVLEGFGFIGCELQAEYVEIALARIGAAKATVGAAK
jgi:site-specific DNA-methyltransferase (adenine-specific)